MSSPFAHLFVGYSIGFVASRLTGLPQRRLIPAAMFCALAPDLDTIALVLGVDHHSVWGHRGILHAAIAAVAIAAVARSVSLAGLQLDATARLRALIALSAAALSHGLLDVFTACDYGVAFFAPFDGARFLSPFRPLPDAPDDPRWYVSSLALRILGAELLWIGLPCIALGYAILSLARARSAAVTGLSPRGALSAAIRS
jgi:LexA-binding, inner membrane-associated putative hydrolase